MINWSQVKVGFLGGDEREEILACHLQKLGAKVNVLGVPSWDIEGVLYKDLYKLISDSDIIIGPMSGTDPQGKLKAYFTEEPPVINKEFYKFLGPERLFLIGMLPKPVWEKAQDMDVQVIKTATLDQIAIPNAIPTAEGAIEIAIREREETIFSSKVLLIGLGRVGRTLGRRLLALGARVYGTARDETSLAWAQEMGIEVFSVEEMGKYISEMELIINSAPAEVLTREFLEKLKAEALIIDLASSPGGTDFETADELGIRAILALGLPGKVAPKTAGKILAEVYPKIISEFWKRRG